MNNKQMTRKKNIRRPNELFCLLALAMRASFICCLLFIFSPSAFAQTSGYDQFLGETVFYDVKSLATKQADASLEFKEKVMINGHEAYLILFKAKGPMITDEEKIFADTEDLYPLRIERVVHYLGSQERIIETYDQDKHTVAVRKTTKAKPAAETFVLKKISKIDNIYCFIYRYRLRGDFKIGSALQMYLPTKDVSIRIMRAEPLKAAGQTYNALFLQTLPRQYELWFDAGAEKIPLRIDKPAAIGGTSMIMREYKK